MLSAWLLSIAGISVLSVLIDVILPSGQTSKYIKSIAAFIMVFVIISPIPKLIKSDFDLESVFQTGDIEIEKDFIYQVNRTKLTFLQSEIQNEVAVSYPKIKITVNADIFELEMQIQNVFVDLSDLVINSESEHINIKKTVTEIVEKYIDIKEDKIIFDE